MSITPEQLFLLPKTERIYRANLHTHTTLSDGEMSLEDVKALYKERGYQIVAFTDHEVCLPHPELNEEDFLALTSYEVTINETIPHATNKTYHFNLLAKKEDTVGVVCFDSRYLYYGDCGKYADNAQILSYADRNYSLESANQLIREANAAGYLVTYNHPCWSRQGHEDFIGLEGLWGIEVFNSACNQMGYDDNQPWIYETLLLSGKKVFPVAADDTHATYDLFGGWVMVAAKSLNYDDVMFALENGDFYASTGPDFHSITMEGGKLKITCSPCRNIRVRMETRCPGYIEAPSGQTLCEAEFDMHRWFDLCAEGNEDNAFFRITLEDAEGKRAYSRPFYRKEVEAQFK